ncbi:MAG TPA: zf-HC2 domain-containing protein, partial [Candidatus Acidoferrales bacterium]|nr:zf-HC2 domain-containing protein [Candidatus Acidoferrales bacterium]
MSTAPGNSFARSLAHIFRRVIRRQAMKNEKFDRLLSEIRNEQVDDQVVAQAGERVWKSIAGTAPSAELSAHTLRNCEDFQALISAYLGKQLAPARVFLFEDHVHACVACRHAVERARDGELQTVWRVENKRPASIAWQWALGGAALCAVAIAGFALNNAYNEGLLPGQHSVRASVQTVEGGLYTGSGAGMRVIPVGYEIRNGDEIRTAKGSTAVVRLLDGSLV